MAKSARGVGNITTQYRLQYDRLMSDLIYDEAELKKAEHLLSDKFTWNDRGARTAKTAYTQSIKDTKKQIISHLKKSKRALDAKEVTKYWKDTDLQMHGIPVP